MGNRDLHDEGTSEGEQRPVQQEVPPPKSENYRELITSVFPIEADGWMAPAAWAAAWQQQGRRCVFQSQPPRRCSGKGRSACFLSTSLTDADIQMPDTN